MKKIFMLLILTSLLAGIIGCAKTNQLPDSVNVPEDEVSLIKSQITLNDEYTVLKAYNCNFMSGFMQNASIDEMTKKPYTLEEYYFLIIDRPEQDYFDVTPVRIVEDKVFRLDMFAKQMIVREALCRYATSYKRLFACILTQAEMKDLHVSEIYCLDYTASQGDGCLYFVTNRGDYVYLYRFAGIETPGFLMPADTFYDFVQKADPQLCYPLAGELLEQLKSYLVYPE